MPASLYQSNFTMDRITTAAGIGEMESPDNRAVKLALELAMLGYNDNQSLGGLGGDSLSLGNSHTLAQLEELKARKSQNMTECVPVPTSEHVAEIVGRQGCKIKALRAKTNTYIKTPVRGEEPVFVVTGRKEDVTLAKREIISAAEHFSQIRASRKNNINSTLAFGQLVANTPGQSTIQVRVPYRVVGLVVGPKGATIKRIQQQTHTYIVTPSRDKDPVFEVTGLPENVEAAKKEIEAHIVLRTGTGLFDGIDGGIDDDGVGLPNNFNSAFNNQTNGSSNGSGMDRMLSRSDSLNGGGTNANLLTKYSTNSILSINSQTNNSMNGLGRGGYSPNGLDDLSHLQHLLDGNNFNGGTHINKRENGSIGGALWGCGDSHDSGIGHSPPYDSNDSIGLHNGTTIWSELGKVFGSRDSPDPSHPSATTSLLSSAISKPGIERVNSFTNDLTPRSASIDLGIPLMPGVSNLNNHHNDMSSQENQTQSLPFSLLGQTSLASLSASLNTLSVAGCGDDSPLLASIRAHNRRTQSPDQESSQGPLVDNVAFSTVVDKPLGCSRDFLTFANH